MPGENNKKGCSHLLKRSDDKQFSCEEQGEHDTHRHRDLRWRTGESGRWRIDGDGMRVPGQEEYVDYRDEEG